MDNVLVISPHSDDAILSCSNFIFSSDFNTKVLTIENDEKRIKEDKALFSFIGVKFKSLDFDIQDDNSYSDFFKSLGKNTVLSNNNVTTYFRKKFGNKKYLLFCKTLQKTVKQYLNKGYIILCPMGIGHPFHYLVRYFLRKYENTFIFYREFPHSYKRKAKEQWDIEQNKLELLFDFNDKETSDLKYQLAQKFYKTQSGFFFYEHSNILKNYPEEFYVYKRINDEPRRIKIYVISKGRPNGKTFDFLNRAGVEYTVTVEPQDVEQYRAAGHKNILVLPENDRGVSYTMNYSKNQYDGRNPVVIMDDDIMNFYYSVPGESKISKSLKTSEELKEFFDKLSNEILNTDFDIGTIGKSAFDWSCTDVSPRIAYNGSKIKYSALAVVTIINNTKLLKFDFDETLCLKGDIDYTLKCMYLGFKYAKFVHYLQQTTMNKDGKQKGGLAESYKRVENIIKSQEILLERWKDNISIDLKKKPNHGIPELRTKFFISENTPPIIKELEAVIK